MEIVHHDHEHHDVSIGVIGAMLAGMLRGHPYRVIAAYEEYIVNELQGKGHMHAKRIRCDFRGMTRLKHPQIKVHTGHRTNFQTCLGPQLSLCSNLCGRETLYRLRILCQNALRSLRPRVVTNRTCLTRSSLSLIILCVNVLRSFRPRVVTIRICLTCSSLDLIVYS